VLHLDPEVHERNEQLIAALGRERHEFLDQVVVPVAIERRLGVVRHGAGRAFHDAPAARAALLADFDGHAGLDRLDIFDVDQRPARGRGAHDDIGP